jgi:hypothetical protein
MQVATAAIEFKHSSRDAIEEMAIVADDHESASKCEELILEPRYSAEIKVVRRLIEHEQLGRLSEGASEGDALRLSSGQPRDVGCQFGAHAEALGNGLGLPTIADRVPHRSRCKHRLLV